MEKMECDKDMEIPIIDEYKKIMSEAEGREVMLGRRMSCVDWRGVC